LSKLKHLKPLLIEGQQSGFFQGHFNDDLTLIVMGFSDLMYKWRMAEFQFDIEIEDKIRSILIIHIK
jgi:hypothetical protein